LRPPADACRVAAQAQNKKHKKMKTRSSPGSDRLRAVRRVTFWTAMALAAVLLISLFVRAQREPASPGIAYANDLHAELAAAAPPPPAAAPSARKRATKPPRASANASGLKLIPVTTDDNVKRVALVDKAPPEETLVHAAFAAPAGPPVAPPAPAPEPMLGWGAWNQPPPDPLSGPGGLRHIPGLNPTLTAAAPNPDAPTGQAAAPRANAPGGELPRIDLPGLPPGKANGWHHGHFEGGTLQAHQHGNANHKAHPRSGGR
jgi:hypothetical protein